MKHTKLELTWIDKDKQRRLEPRILIEDPELSYHADRRVGADDLFDNRLIFGDNLLALKALEREFYGRIKCVYIDPPFNTGQALTHYDDGREHSIWLGLMRDRCELLRNLLAPDGTLIAHIDDNELGYFIVLLDEIFGRANRLYVVTFKQGSATGHKAINPGCVSTTNFLLLYARDKASWKPNRVFTARERDKRYGQFIMNRDEDYPNWKFTTVAKAFALSVGMTDREAKKSFEDYNERLDAFVLSNADAVTRLARPDYESVGAKAREVIDESRKQAGRIVLLERDGYPSMYFVGGERILFYSDKVKMIDGEAVAGEPLTTLWDDILSNNLHKEGGVEFPKGKKPEGLIKRVLDLTTKPGDWVLDSFAGSGTTGAVAHKMRRRWVMVELGEHCHTHVLPRIKAVVDGSDQEGVSKAVSWSGGGGFRYYRLAPSLLEKDKYGNWVISKQFNAAMLSEAVCKHEGFTYAPSETVYWQQGFSTECDFIYVTTQSFNQQQLSALSEDVGDNRTLLVCCTAFRCKADQFRNLTLKKIPKAVLERCEWGRDDYSLQITHLPVAELSDAAIDANNGAPATRRKKKGWIPVADQSPLFSEEVEA